MSTENYRALTRKYRPHTFGDIVSQDHVSNTLINAIKQGRLSHAYMFCGPRGVGKTTMARVLARTINELDDSIDGESLNQTLNIVEMDAASNNKVDDVHHLRESVRIPPQNGKYKVFIVDEVHMLSKAAFNALLKTLEEPPEHAIFIFATTEPHKVLPTILSRVQRFDFKRIAVEEIVQRLRKISLDENISIDEESLHVIAKKADGALRDALGLMDQAIAFCGDTITHDELLKALNVVGSDRLFDFMNCVKEHDADAGLKLIDQLLQDGYDIQEFLIGLTEHLRNLYIAHHSEQMYLVEASDETKKRYRSTATDFNRDDLMRMLHIVSESQIKIKDASQPRIQFEIALLKLIHMERSEQLGKLLGELDQLKKNSKNFLNGSSASSSSVNGQQNASTAQEPAQKEESQSHESVNKDELPVKTSDTTELNGQVSDDLTSVNEPPDFVTEEESLNEIVQEQEDDDEFDLGRPALQTDLNKRVQAHKEATSTAVAEPVQSEAEEEAPEKITLHYVQEKWDTYLESLKGDVPMMLHLQLERARLGKLEGRELTLQCNDQFAMKMLEEQSLELAKKLKECVGCMLRFNIIVKKDPTQKTKEMSPYERFKQLQQKDPMIRDIVEIFGAELEYKS
ncbi:DNA polymerase III subunit gamma/tau [Balneola sp. MJW-20]|uniref:DNA polymerase III subunit gamma/tau n=1 Tax=Gracilimonas aurantiaca TaxID=3234185 RepID=UPI003467B3BA